MTFRIFAILWLLTSTALHAGQQHVLVAAGGKLTVLKADQGGQLTETQSFEMNGSAGPMGLSPDERLLYINTHLPEDKKVPAFATFSVSESGELALLHTAPSVWNNGYLRVDATGRYIAGNNYGIGKVGIWEIAEDGIYRGAEPRDFELEKRAHSAVFSANNHHLFVPATGPNKVFQLVFNAETGAVHPNQPSSAPGPVAMDTAREPRHIVLHPTLDMAYTTQERLYPGAAAWKYDRDKGLLELAQTIRTAPGDAEKMSTADLHISVDGKFLYVSNRDGLDKKSPTGRDVISCFSIDQETGLLTLVDHFPCERVPRSFALGRYGDFAYVGGQGDSKLGVYQIHRETGHLKKITSYDMPGSIRWVTVIKSK